MKLRLCCMTKEGLRIELATYDSPGQVGEAQRRPMNKIGMTHICMSVNDVDAVARLIVKFGGAILEQTRCQASFGDFVFATDPNGVRLELWRKSDAAPF